MLSPMKIDYYTDVLCVWAWIAHRRNQQLEQDYGDQVQLKNHYLPLFSDTMTRMQDQWGHRGSYHSFADHLQEACSPYEFAPVHEHVWRKARPTTSSNAHLLLKAVELEYDDQQSSDLAFTIRQAFFRDAWDISQLPLLLELAQDQGLDPKNLIYALENGTAIAALMSDHSLAQQQNIKGSPSWVMNEGRQVIYGNVGYRVLHANVEELIRQPEHEASWC